METFSLSRSNVRALDSIRVISRERYKSLAVWESAKWRCSSYTAKHHFNGIFLGRVLSITILSAWVDSISRQHVGLVVLKQNLFSPFKLSNHMQRAILNGQQSTKQINTVPGGKGGLLQLVHWFNNKTQCTLRGYQIDWVHRRRGFNLRMLRWLAHIYHRIAPVVDCS